MTNSLIESTECNLYTVNIAVENNFQASSSSVLAIGTTACLSLLSHNGIASGKRTGHLHTAERG